MNRGRIFRIALRHEMLHDLLRGDRDHERPEWALCGLERGVPEGAPPSP